MTAAKRPQGGVSDGSAMCGGVVKKSEFMKDPMAYMMAWIMPDKQFEQYVKLKNSGQDKEARKIFDEYATSAV